MILVQEPDGIRVFVCGPDTARHIGPDERDAYLETGLVPFLKGDTDAQRKRRAAMLTARGVQL